MNRSPDHDQIEYLVLGHVTQDKVDEGYILGGTAAYASLLALRLGLVVGLVTAVSSDTSLAPLEGVKIHNLPARNTTTFENQYGSQGRSQTLHQRASALHYHDIPPAWRSADIVHLAPVAQEIDHQLMVKFPRAFVGISLQGWLRRWDETGHVRPAPAGFSLHRCPTSSAVVLSYEDLDNDQDQIQRYARQCSLLIATKGRAGADVYHRGDQLHIPTDPQPERDPTGAGDIFASAFFIHYARNQELVQAAQYATALAARSVSRAGLDGVPTEKELQAVQEVY